MPMALANALAMAQGGGGMAPLSLQDLQAAAAVAGASHVAAGGAHLFDPASSAAPLQGTPAAEQAKLSQANLLASLVMPGPVPVPRLPGMDVVTNPLLAQQLQALTTHLQIQQLQALLALQQQQLLQPPQSAVQLSSAAASMAD
eukprot:CAMPEP_0182890310 /NCGR_PEP_ID=MMETSP0034_2-20130328/22583_1 /TAXON_ID=156128 /ORGANISM="Nephroselmis pyriformis, Strain CCMP717" /LENGTH=143 /DNA_ID=CAMNT_0025023847 /DNA_START=15 /DNA_END=443 /DNA_ORIENTATION=+